MPAVKFNRSPKIAAAPADAIRDGFDRLGRGDLAGAMATCQALLARRQDNADAWNLAGLVAAARGELTAAERFYARAIELDPGFVEAHSNRGVVLSRSGRGDEALAAFAAALARRPDDRAAAYNQLLASLYLTSVSPETVADLHRRWGQILAADAPRLAPAAPPAPRTGRPLRIGYVSADFKRHSVAWFLAPLLAHHDRRRVTVHAYANLGGGDDVTASLRAHVDHWHPIAERTDADVAHQIAADGIDVLIDLAGHTTGNRLGVFARRPAPVQISYLGYPATTGLCAIDYRLTDAWADPPGASERLHAETLVRLPRGFLCYGPPEVPWRPVPPCVDRGMVTFASFNDAAKLSNGTLQLWARVLRAVPTARLVLKARGFSDAGVRERVLRALGAAGVDPARVELFGFYPGVEQHLAAYGEVDIALDSFPYNGTTTTCEALWMGVPVVTLAGIAHAARVGVSLLSCVGLRELCAPSEDEFVARAAALAQSPARLCTLRAGMRDRLRSSPLLDARGFVQQLEETYERLWDERCAS